MDLCRQQAQSPQSRHRHGPRRQPRGTRRRSTSADSQYAIGPVSVDRLVAARLPKALLACMSDSSARRQDETALLLPVHHDMSFDRERKRSEREGAQRACVMLSLLEADWLMSQIRGTEGSDEKPGSVPHEH